MTAAARHGVNCGGVLVLSPSFQTQTAGEKKLFPADFAGIDELVESCWAAVNDDLIHSGYGPREETIHLALREALVNALQHGNCRRPDLPIIFRWRFADNLTFEVLDAGQGFACQVDTLIPDRLTAEHGRGLAIIRFCADNICWEKDGSHVIITFIRP